MDNEYFKENWYQECFQDGVLVIPDGVSEIPDFVFRYNEEIRKVVFPAEHKVKIGGHVFWGCSNLESIDNISSMEDEEGHSALFYGCTKLFVEERDIDDEGHMELEIDGRTYDLGYHEDSSAYPARSLAFAVNIWYKLHCKEVGHDVDKTTFCCRRATHKFGKDFEYLFENGALYNTRRSTLVLFLPKFSNGNLIIPEWVESIDIKVDRVIDETTGEVNDFPAPILDVKSLSFLGNTDLSKIHWISFPSLERLVLSPLQTVIPDHAFENCEKLKEITFPDTLTRIKGGAFNRCRSLERLVFPCSLRSIGDPCDMFSFRSHSNTFEYCDSLQEVTFMVGDELTLEDGGFSVCKNLRRVCLKGDGDGRHHCTIRSEFGGCNSLEAIHLEEVDLDIERGTFNGCSSLNTLEGWPDSFRIQGGGLFRDGHLVSTLQRELTYPEGSEWLDDSVGFWIEILRLPSSIKYIEDIPGEYIEHPSLQDDATTSWWPPYMRPSKIIVPKGYRKYFINLFTAHYEQIKEYTYPPVRFERGFHEVMNEIVSEE